MLNSDTSRTPHGTVVPTRLPMGSWATTPAIRRVMQGNRSRDTKPEIAVRSAVHALGCAIAFQRTRDEISGELLTWSFGTRRSQFLLMAASGMDAQNIMRHPRQTRAIGQRRFEATRVETRTRQNGFAEKAGPS
jgi:hypothetical protein